MKLTTRTSFRIASGGRDPSAARGSGMGSSISEYVRLAARSGSAHPTTFMMCVAAATTAPVWVVQVTRAKVFPAASSRSTIS